MRCSTLREFCWSSLGKSTCKQVRAEERHELCLEVGYDFRLDYFILDNLLGDSSLGEAHFSSLSHWLLAVLLPVIGPSDSSLPQ